jgi:formyltetrahydrofolate synthetase
VCQNACRQLPNIRMFSKPVLIFINYFLIDNQRQLEKRGYLLF